MLVGVQVGVSRHISYSVVSYLYVNVIELITSVGEGADFFLLSITICLEAFPLLLGVYDRLRYLIVALPRPSI